MDKMRMESVNMTEKNIEKIEALFPNVITEAKDEKGKLKKAVNFELLKQILSDDVLVGDEAYEFTWVGKKASIVEAGKPIRKTLRPCKEESKDWDTTENLYIEGDNLDVLKLLQESYLGAIKVIYIDPPYNTGNDFIFNDSFAMSVGDYDEETEYLSEEGLIQYKKNDQSNPRYHSKWCSMMYSRLQVARNVLSDDGVIFISIGEAEISNMQKMCDEIFGAINCIEIVPRLMKTGGNKGRFFSPNIDYILVYAKSINETGNFKGELNEKLIDKLYNKIETVGSRKGERYRPFGLYQSSLDARPNQRYYVQCPDGSFAIPPGKAMPAEISDGCKVIPNPTDGCWRWSNERYLIEKENNNIVFIESPSGVLIQPDGSKSKWNVYTKIWLSDRQDEGQTPTNFISKFENRHSAKELKELDLPFDFAKPSELIEYLLSLVDDTRGAIVCDFFSGSATTAHAVMHLNAIDNLKRKFIMVQLPEECLSDSEAYKSGYKNICEIGKERIRRAGEKIKEEAGVTAQDLDIGFRVLKLGSTNMKDVYYGAAEYSQSLLDDLTSNIKDDRTDLDLLYGCLLEWGLPLSLPHTSEGIGGVTVHTINDGDLIACFADNISEKVIKEIAKRQPLRAVFRDSSFASSPEKINVEEIFKLMAPNTSVKVL
ncbi:site-specific DNA-methyltransferase [Phosphitispora sp. TUW77]|uniref:site-specific DNA-methyltransferase n=1 Tax=Phosphitispora sp. TUW77 TaxID=3152361 RepID=UPI003AB6A1CF